MNHPEDDLRWASRGEVVGRARMCPEPLQALTDVLTDCFAAFTFHSEYCGWPDCAYVDGCGRVQIVGSPSAKYLAMRWTCPRGRRVELRWLRHPEAMRELPPQILILQENLIEWKPKQKAKKGEVALVGGYARAWPWILERLPKRPTDLSRVVLFEMNTGLDLRTRVPPGRVCPPRDPLAHDGYARDLEVRAWALARADGRCESCGSAAPFVGPDGEPYLEVHHLQRLADGGPDTPENVAGLCPNCHREIHLGLRGPEVTRRLRELRESGRA